MAFMANKSKRTVLYPLLDLFAGLRVSFPCLAFLLALAVSELVPFVVLKYESFPGHSILSDIGGEVGQCACGNLQSKEKFGINGLLADGVKVCGRVRRLVCIRPFFRFRLRSARRE